MNHLWLIRFLTVPRSGFLRSGWSGILTWGLFSFLAVWCQPVWNSAGGSGGGWAGWGKSCSHSGSSWYSRGRKVVKQNIRNGHEEQDRRKARKVVTVMFVSHLRKQGRVIGYWTLSFDMKGIPSCNFWRVAALSDILSFPAVHQSGALKWSSNPEHWQYVSWPLFLTV